MYMHCAVKMRDHKLTTDNAARLTHCRTESYLECDVASLLERFVGIDLHVLSIFEHVQCGDAIAGLICSLRNIVTLISVFSRTNYSDKSTVI